MVTGAEKSGCNSEGAALRPSSRRRAWWLYIAFSCLYLFTSRGNIASEDAGLRLLMAQRLLDGQNMICEYYRPNWQRPHIMHWWLGHPLILTIPELTARAVVKLKPGLPKEYVSEALACALHALTAAAIPVLVYLWTLAAGYTVRAAIMAGFTTAAATLVWKYSQDCHYEIHEGLFVSAAFFAAYLAWRRRSLKHCAIAGACAGAAWMVRVTNLLYVLAVMAAWLVPLSIEKPGSVGRRFSLLWTLCSFTAAFLPFWIAESVFDYWRYGVWPVPADYRSPPLSPLRLEDVPGYFYASILGPTHGIIWFMPTMVVGLVFSARLVRRFGWYAAALTGALLADFVLATILAPIAGDIRSWGLRFFVRGIPASGLLIAEWMEWAGEDGRLRSKLTYLFLAVVIALQFISTTVFHLRWFQEREVCSAKGLPPPPHPYIAQIGFLRQAFSNYLHGRRFERPHRGQSPEEMLRETALLNYPNYWWTLPVAFGAPRWPLLLGAVGVLLASIFAFSRAFALAQECRDSSDTIVREGRG